MRWSPQQIAARLVVDYPDDPEMRVSHETIYQSLFVQARGALRPSSLAACAPAGRNAGRGRIEVRGQGQLRDMVLLSERPAEVADRAVPGHWEGDLIIGKAGGSAIGTLVERQSRYRDAARTCPTGAPPNTSARRLAAKILTLPEQLRRSLTWDRGKEMAEHVRFTIDTGVQVYFCDPHSPWQRGCNENANGLLRQYFPKGTDLSVHAAAHLDAVAARAQRAPSTDPRLADTLRGVRRAVAMTG